MNTALIISLAILCLLILGTKGNNITAKLVFLFLINEIIIISVETPDTEAYRNFYNAFDNHGYSIYDFEYGFTLLSIMCKSIFGGNIAWLYLFSSSICFVITLYACRNIVSVLTNINRGRFLLSSIIVYISYYGLYYNAIAIRASFSLSLSMLIFSILLKKGISFKNFIAVLALITVSFAFHNSSFVIFMVLSCLFLPQLTQKQYLIISILIISSFYLKLSNLLFNILPLDLLSLSISSNDVAYGYKVTGYINDALQTNAKSNFFILHSVLLIYLLLNYRKDIPYQLLNIYIVGLLIHSLFSFLPSINRVSDYFIVYSFVLVAWLISKCKFNIVQYFVISVLISANFLAVCRIMNVVYR